MKITKVTPMILGTQWRNLVHVKVETDEGIVGVGESRPLNKHETLVGYLSDISERYIVGSDPFEIERLVRRLTVEDYGRPGEVVMTGTVAARVSCRRQTCGRQGLSRAQVRSLWCRFL